MSAFAQTTPAVPVDQAAGALPRLVNFTGTLTNEQGTVAVTFALYKERTGGTPLWQEEQQVTADANGSYAVYLGATTAQGMPLDVFASGKARWLGVQVAGQAEEPRVMLVSVPYALAAGDAQTLGGKPASAYQQASAEGTTGAATASGATSTPGVSLLPVPAAVSGSTNYLAMFTSPTDVGTSALYQNGSLVGLNTTTPLDMMHVRFTNTNGGMAGFAVQNLGTTSTSYSGMLFYDQNGALGQFQGFNNSTHEYRINNIATNGTINFMLGATNSIFKANATGVRMPKMTQLGSETGTSQAPTVSNDGPYTGLVVRRINSTDTTAGSVVARTDFLTLERDGTNGGFRITVNTNNGLDVACMGVDSSGGSANRVLNLNIGTTALYADATNIVYFQCSFGFPFLGGHETQVSLHREASDFYWIGTVTSTYNQ